MQRTHSKSNSGRGFASMSPRKRKQVASMGGRASHDSDYQRDDRSVGHSYDRSFDGDRDSEQRLNSRLSRGGASDGNRSIDRRYRDTDRFANDRDEHSYGNSRYSSDRDVDRNERNSGSGNSRNERQWLSSDDNDSDYGARNLRSRYSRGNESEESHREDDSGNRRQRRASSSRDENSADDYDLDRDESDEDESVRKNSRSRYRDEEQDDDGDYDWRGGSRS